MTKLFIYKIALGALAALTAFAAASCSSNKSETKPSAPTEAQKKAEAEGIASKRKVTAASVLESDVKVSLNAQEVEALMKLGRKALDSFVKETKIYKPAPGELPSGLAEKKGNMVFATIYYKGDWRGCMASRDDFLYRSVINSAVNAAQDTRFDGRNPKPEDLKDIRLEISVLQPRSLLEGKDPEEMTKNFKMGGEGLFLSSGGYSAYFLPYVFVKKHLPLKTWLERLSRKASADKDGNLWQKDESLVFKYETINFVEEKPYGAPAPLYRYKVVRPSVDSAALGGGFKQAVKFFDSNFDSKESLFNNGYFSVNSQPLTSVNMCDEARAVYYLSGLEEKKYGFKFANLDAVMKRMLKTALSDSSGVITVESGQGAKTGDFCANMLLLNAISARAANGKTGSDEKKAAENILKWVETSAMKEGKTLDLRGLFLNAAEVDYAAGLLLEALSNAALTLKIKRASELADEVYPQVVKFSGDDGIYFNRFAGLAAYYKTTKKEEAASAALAAAQDVFKSQIKPGPDVEPDKIGGTKKTGKADTLQTALSLIMWSESLKLLGIVKNKPASAEEFKREALRCAVLAAKFLYERQINEANGFFFPAFDKIAGGFYKEGTQFEITPGLSAAGFFALKSILDSAGAGAFDEYAKALSVSFPALY